MTEHRWCCRPCVRCISSHVGGWSSGAQIVCRKHATQRWPRYGEPVRFVLCNVLLLLSAYSASGEPTLEALQNAPKEARQRALAEASGLTDDDALIRFIGRPHQYTPAQRAALLLSIGASVPDETGRFVVPPRGTQQTKDVDWLSALLPSDDASAGEVIADLVALRALADRPGYEPAAAIFAIAFAPETYVLRDECGRLLRAMNPRSLPALIRLSKSQGDQARYANYQLERLDRQDPHKALAQGQNDVNLRLAILTAFRDVKHREAVGAVWTLVNDDVRVVREVARIAWLVYVTGPAPKAAPKKRLQLTGGRVAKKPSPLYLTYRELAEQILRVALEKDLGDEVPPEADVDVAAATTRLFDHYDGQRNQQAQGTLATALTLASKGDEAQAMLLLDELRTEGAIIANPGMATVYATAARRAGSESRWADVISLFAKAQLAGHPPTDADRAAELYALSQLAEANQGAIRAEAAKLDRTFGLPERVVAKPRWPLWLGIALGVSALVTAVTALARKRAA